jgi:hypothetical protein
MKRSFSACVMGVVLCLACALSKTPVSSQSPPQTRATCTRVRSHIGSAHQGVAAVSGYFSKAAACCGLPSLSRRAVSGYSHCLQRGCFVFVEYDRIQYNMQHISSYISIAITKEKYPDIIWIVSGYWILSGYYPDTMRILTNACDTLQAHSNL